MVRTPAIEASSPVGLGVGATRLRHQDEQEREPAQAAGIQTPFAYWRNSIETGSGPAGRALGQLVEV